MNDEDIFIKKVWCVHKKKPKRKTQMLYCDFCSSIITLISLLVPPIYYAHESYQNRVWTIGYFRLSGQEMQSLVIPYIYIIVIVHINFHGQNVYFAGFGVIMFKDKPYWNPLFGFLKNKLTNSSLEHNSTFAI